MPPDLANAMPRGRRVVITGVGVVSPIGSSVPEMWDSIESGLSGVTYISRFDASGFLTQIAAEVPDADEPNPRFDEDYWTALDRRSRFAIRAAVEATDGADLPLTEATRDRTAVIIASERPEEDTLLVGAEEFFGGLIDSAAQVLAPHARPHAPSERVAALLGVGGPVLQLESRSAGGLNAIIEAAALIANGEADAAIAGGAEAPITPLTLAAFQGTGALSARNRDPSGASRPLDMERDGFVLGEGAALVVLETLDGARARGAPLLAEVEGWGRTFSPGTGGVPAMDALAIAEALTRSLETAARDRSEVDLLMLHAAGTMEGDRIEARAIAQAFGATARSQLYSPATKSQTGHLLGASSSLNVAILLEAFARQRIPGTINLTRQDPECDLDANPSGTSEGRAHIGIVNATGWAHNSALLLSDLVSMRE